MTGKKNDNDMDFRVTTNDGTMVKGFDTLEEAQASAKKRNADAEEMGIKTRYESGANPLAKAS
jgi:hypothetical protein